MRIDPELTPEAVLRELGHRLERRRLDLGLSQASAAEQAGIGKRTLERLEAGADAQVSTLVRLLRVLDLLDGLQGLVPEPGPRPMDLLKLRGRERRRASAPRGDRPGKTWQWGDGG